MTDPLVPPEVDLRDFDYLPLYGDRLFNSDTWALCDSDEKVAALRLWWRAWHEEPAGSLPDNDRLLADRAGYGVAVKAFLAVKENAMRGWTRCSDGRLYHPVVASIALEVWQTKRKKKADNAADRERKRLKRLAEEAAKQAPCPPENAQIPPDVHLENALKGKGREVEDSVGSNEPPAGKPASRDPIKAIFDRGVEVFAKGGVAEPQARSLLAKWRRDAGDPAVMAAIMDCEKEAAVEPISYFVKCVEHHRKPRAKVYSGGVIPMHPGAGG